MKPIVIVDYGMGNLRSVQKAFEKIGASAQIVFTASGIAGADKLVLPGVGAFGDAMTRIREAGLAPPILDHLHSGRPFLGICLGLQLLFDASYEDGEYAGLGIVPGEVVRFESQPGLKIPHMGWNALEVAKPNPLLAGMPAGAHVYFVHSYHVVPRDESIVAARAFHGQPFVAMIARDNLFATQFHPEKSQRIGLQLLENFARL